MIRIENTRYRDDRRSIQEAVSLLRAEVGDERELDLVPTRMGIPLLVVRFAAALSDSAASETAGRDPSGVSLDYSSVPHALLKDRGASSSVGRVDVVVHPYFEAAFGNFDNPIASRTGVAPELRVLLRPGLWLSAQALLTLQDDLPTGDSRVRPLAVTLSQTMRLPWNVFVSATAGTFTSDRYGVDLEVRTYSNDARWMAGAELGFTGGSSFGRREWRFQPMREPTTLLQLARWVPRYDLSLRATAGVYLAGERGARMDVVRRFGEFELGGFALTSNEGANGGFTMRIPLPQARYGKPAPVRIRAADAFPWQYRYRGLVTAGRRYDAGNVLEDLDRTLRFDRSANP